MFCSGPRVPCRACQRPGHDVSQRVSPAAPVQRHAPPRARYHATEVCGGAE